MDVSSLRQPLTTPVPRVDAAGMAPETFNPWTVVNLVFRHLADNGLHPVLGETGDPAVPATALLRAMGIEPGRNDESVTSPLVQDQLAAMRAHFFGEEPGEPRDLDER
jgi:hypothetical protein